MRLVIFILFCSISFRSVAQNVGIGTALPQSRMDINGDLALRGLPLTLTDGINDDVDLTTSKNTLYRVTGPTAAFSITSFTGGVDGRMIMIFNATNFPMTLVDMASSGTAANRIITGANRNVTISDSGFATLIYSTTDNRWIVTGTNVEKNIQIIGANATTTHSIPHNALDVPINGTTVSLTTDAGTNTNYRAHITGFARIHSGLTFTGTSCLGAFFLVLRRAEDAAFTVNNTILTYTSGQCAIRTPNGAGSATLGYGDGPAISYYDSNLLPNKTYYYRLTLYGNSIGVNGGTFEVYERNLTITLSKN